VLGWPAGRFIVVVAGLIIIGVGVAAVVKGLQRSTHIAVTERNGVGPPPPLPGLDQFLARAPTGGPSCRIPGRFRTRVITMEVTPDPHVESTPPSGRRQGRGSTADRHHHQTTRAASGLANG
jgi:hypothetical protein